MAGWLRANRPALLLALLAPTVAELLSGSTKITVLFVAPAFFLLAFAGLVLLYGGGALLVREASVRWKKGWATVLLLGAAYGIVEEGLAVHTFFQPGGSPVNALGSFGRLGGVNVLWALGLTVFHATISIALPILLIELTFPATRGVPFLDRRSAVATATGYIAVVVLFASITPHAPSLALLALFLLVVAALVLLAYRVPRSFLRPRDGPPRAPAWAFAVAGATMMIAWVVFGYGGPALFRSAWLSGAGFAAVLGLDLVFVLRCAGTEGVEESEFWFAAGMLGFFVVFWDVILEFAGVPGILLLSVAFLGYLYWLGPRVKARSDAARKRSEVPAHVSGVT